MRIYHPWHTWECVPAGMYDTLPPHGVSPDEARGLYRDFLRDDARFSDALRCVLNEWPTACEHFLSNAGMNRIAWLGQASMCIATGVPARFRAGFYLLSPKEQQAANATAARALCRWQGRPQSDLSFGSAEASTPDLDPRLTGATLRERVHQYVAAWESRGYAQGLPDEVPAELERLGLAPSYKAIAVAILRNDHALLSLGGVPRVSGWYGAIKQVEIAARPKPERPQLEMFS